MHTDLTAPMSAGAVAVERAPAPQAQAPSAESVAAAILFREILKPLADGLGPVDEIALGAVADGLFVRRPR